MADMKITSVFCESAVLCFYFGLLFKLNGFFILALLSPGIYNGTQSNNFMKIK